MPKLIFTTHIFNSHNLPKKWFLSTKFNSTESRKCINGLWSLTIYRNICETNLPNQPKQTSTLHPAQQTEHSHFSITLLNTHKLQPLQIPIHTHTHIHINKQKDTTHVKIKLNKHNTYLNLSFRQNPLKGFGQGVVFEVFNDRMEKTSLLFFS